MIRKRRLLYATAVTAAILILAAIALRSEIELRVSLRWPQTEQPDHPSIVMLGDSHTGFVNWPRLLHCPRIATFGVGGNTTSQILVRLPSVLTGDTRLVVLMAGTNDALQNLPAEDTRVNLLEIERTVVSRGIKFISLTPPPLPDRSDLIGSAILAASTRVPFTEEDLGRDKIHLRRSGYAKWRDVIYPIIQQFC